ncbi:MAG: hypothetical protein D4S01_06425 [Dehalococcoidia bacterium]|nr:MAG: hypothetical protein D4S01_06425 [Dehalococcoidia bacterium]
MLNLENKAFQIFGLPDSGKSTLANFILNQYGKSAFVYDTLAEFSDEPYDSYVPKNRGSVAELEQVIRNAMACRRYKLIYIDELNRFCPSKPAPLPQAIADINDWRAHYGLVFGGAARRPVQLNQDLTELAHYLFIFKLTGKNDIQYLNDMSEGLGDLVKALAPYHFVVLNPGRDYQVYSPVPIEFKTSKKLTA